VLATWFVALSALGLLPAAALPNQLS